MSAAMWAFVLAVAILEASVIIGAGFNVWDTSNPEQQARLAAFWSSHEGMALLVVLAVQLLPAAAISLIFRWYVLPLRSIAEETRMIAVGNFRHRLNRPRPAELSEITEAVNLLAENYQRLQDDVEARIRHANTLVEEERNTLAALIAQLTLGVVVCDRDGRIILYNGLAQRLLEGFVRPDGGSDWIGLGRSVFTVLDRSILDHAIAHVRDRLSASETAMLVPFVTTRPTGQTLGIHLVPIVGDEGALDGYVLTLEDITRRSGAENRRDELLQSLIRGQRSSIAAVRAAIEIVLTHPELPAPALESFLQAINEEATRIGDLLDRWEREYAPDPTRGGTLSEVVGSELLADIRHRIAEALDLPVEVSAPLEPLWLKVDSYTIVRCMVFLLDHVRRACRPQQIEIRLEAGRTLAALIVEWTGAFLDLEALKSWGGQNVFKREDGTGVTLFAAIERHDGAIWTRTAEAGRRPAIHLVLPIADIDAAAMINRVPQTTRSDFDLRLLQSESNDVNRDDLPLDAITCTVIDTETTGLEPDRGDEIIAIAAVRIVNGRILRGEVFDTLVNPQRPVPEASAAIHGITAGMLRGAPTINAVLPRFVRFVEDTVIVGHNVAFDLRFLAAKQAATGITFTNPVLDTLLLEWHVHPRQQDKDLEVIAARFGIAVAGRHTALGDALITAEIFLALVPILKQRGIATLGQARRACEQSPMARLTS
jgi:DNA polymerase-3 subunit epsilon